MATVAIWQREPDGRPLYAYKCRDEEYERLKEMVCEQMPTTLSGRKQLHFAATFCFYAAETFRRRHEGGPWETVFAEIGHTTPAYPRIYEWVSQGLAWWRRPLLKSHSGDREFLLTLGCEGGLPLRLLRKENAHLSRYFRELLTAYHRERHTPGCDATDVARRVAVRYLPASLRHDIVFKLSGDLIHSVVKLQAQVAETANPITFLDRAQPQWRDDLPLPVEDATVEALLRNLVGQARNLAQTERQRWRWRCYLAQRGESWSIEQLLELPNTVTGTSLQAWSHWNDPPARLRVLLQTAEGIDAIALLTRLQGTGGQATYRCEGLRRGRVRLLGSAATAGARLLLSNGNEEVELPTLGGQELGPLPWVFVKRDAQWEWCGEGSVRSRDASVRVLALDEGRCITVDGACESVGSAPDLQRSLYQVTGAVEWQHPELGTCQIRCASQDASEESFLVDGKVLSSMLNLRPPFLGLPSLYAIGRDEMRRRINGAMLEWRPLDAPESAWRTDAATCAGRVWVRYRDASGTLVSSRQELRESLHTAPNEPLLFALHRLQERLASMLAMTGDLDAVVTLEIVDQEGHAMVHLEVAQFDVALEPDWVKGRIVLPPTTLGRFNDGWEERIMVKILPLWDPSTEPINLGRDEADIAWRVPDGLAPGPWWVLGYDSDWARFRPLLWVVQGEKTITIGSELMQAIHEPVHETRQAMVQALISALAANAEHPDWPRLFDSLRLTRPYPASAFDLFRHLMNSPEAMILALLQSADEEFDLVLF